LSCIFYNIVLNNLLSFSLLTAFYWNKFIYLKKYLPFTHMDNTRERGLLCSNCSKYSRTVYAGDDSFHIKNTYLDCYWVLRSPSPSNCKVFRVGPALPVFLWGPSGHRFCYTVSCAASGCNRLPWSPCASLPDILPVWCSRPMDRNESNQVSRVFLRNHADTCI